MHRSRDHEDMDHVTHSVSVVRDRAPGRSTLVQRLPIPHRTTASAPDVHPAQRVAAPAASVAPEQCAADFAAAIGFFGGPAGTIDASVARWNAEHVAQKVDGGDNQAAAAPGAVVGSSSDGLPGALQAGIESMANMDMSGVRVSYNSSKPAELGALAYAQGDNIYLGPGQEQHLPHEAWHVVQQRQGRVPATTQFAGVAVNDDQGLEREADVMGDRAVAMGGTAQLMRATAAPVPMNSGGGGADGVAQMVRVDFGELPVREGGHVNQHCYARYDDIAEGDKYKLVDANGTTYFPKYVVREYGVMEYLWHLAQEINQAQTWNDLGMVGQNHNYDAQIVERGVNYSVMIHVGNNAIHLSGYPRFAGTAPGSVVRP